MIHPISKLLLSFGFIALSNLTSHAPIPKHRWRLINNKHWQVISDNPIKPQEVYDPACPAGMIHVNGPMKQDPGKSPFGSQTIEEMQKTTCVDWINKTYPERCRKFDRDKWLAISKDLPTKDMDFCIDKFEYPNQEGQNPWIMVSFQEAQDIAKKNGKRLCTEEEWTMACEGPEAIPYGYGYERDQVNCNIDKPFRVFNESNMRPRNSDKAMMEMDKLWQGVPSGSNPKCKSAFGVMDMNSNIDEWTQNLRGYGKYPSILRGGAWNGVRNRCRPSTRSHAPSHIFYQQGFRECTDIKQ